VTATRSVPSRAVLVAAASALAVAVVGGSLTRIGPWYRSLKKPPWNPPDPAFGAIWTVIFATAAVAGVTAWRGARTSAGREWVIGLFALNGFLNVVWSLLFFTLQRPDWALIESAALWVSVALLIVCLWPMSRLASLLLAPYLVWVSIAALLNYDVARLNGPFG
jgi:tryptophan-rich sensory protein